MPTTSWLWFGVRGNTCEHTFLFVDASIAVVATYVSGLMMA